MKIYQVVQKISIDALHLKPATPLGRFCPTEKQLSLVAIVTSQPLCHYCSTVNYMHLLA
jgi:hypothetical protein